MRYEHDCERCMFLGEHEEFDLYVCAKDMIITTVIARYGNEGSQYVSGLPFALYWKCGKECGRVTAILGKCLDMALAKGYKVSEV